VPVSFTRNLKQPKTTELLCKVRKFSNSCVIKRLEFAACVCLDMYGSKTTKVNSFICLFLSPISCRCVSRNVYSRQDLTCYNAFGETKKLD